MPGLISDHKLTHNSERNKRKYSRQHYHFRNLLHFDQQVQHHASSRPKNSSSSRHLGQTHNIRLTPIFFKGRPRLSRPREPKAPFLRFKFSHDGIHINMVLVCQYLVPFQILLHHCSNIQMALQCRAAVYPHTILSETPLTLTPSLRLRWAADRHRYLLSRIESRHHYLTNSITYRMRRTFRRAMEISNLLLLDCQKFLVTFHTKSGVNNQQR